MGYNTYESAWERRERIQRNWIIGFVIGIPALCIALGVFFFYPRSMVGKVTQINWTYAVNLHQRTLKHGEGWGHPQSMFTVWNRREDAFNVRCESRQRGYRDCHCYETCHDDCSGSGENRHCTRRCREHCSRCPRYEDWCSYDYYDWPIVQSDVTVGRDHNCEFGHKFDGTLPADQHLSHNQSYLVGFKVERLEEMVLYAPKSKGDYDRFDPGQWWNLKVPRAGEPEPVQLAKFESAE